MTQRESNSENEEGPLYMPTPTADKHNYKRHEFNIRQLLNKDKPKLLQMSSGEQAYKMPVDYEDAWEAVNAMHEHKGKNWKVDVRLKQQVEIMKAYDISRVEGFFKQRQDPDRGTRLLKEFIPASECDVPLRRTKSDPAFFVDKNALREETLNSVVMNSGVNWVCPVNPNNMGLNAPCMQLSQHSSLTTIKPAECSANFNIAANQISLRTEVLRNRVEDHGGKLHDETKVYYSEATTGKTISPWHDISLICHTPPDHIKKDSGLLVNMVVEIPRFHRAKMEISTTRTHNPIIQDRCKPMNRARNYAGPISWNYGALPQTWEDPLHHGDDEVSYAMGDGDPLDVVDMSRDAPKEFVIGEVVPVRVLGCLPMLDGGDELDWKVLVINCYDKNFEFIHDLYSLEQIYPNSLNGVREWFRWYKFNDGGKPLNDFGYNGLILCRCGTEEIIESTHFQWKKLMKTTHRLSKEAYERVSRTEKGLQEKLLFDGDTKTAAECEKAFSPKLQKCLDLGEEFKYNVWVPGKLRPGTKSWKDRNIIWQGHLASNAGKHKNNGLKVQKSGIETMDDSRHKSFVLERK